LLLAGGAILAFVLGGMQTVFLDGVCAATIDLEESSGGCGELALKRLEGC